MIADLSLIVALRGHDPVALTAEHALTRRLGYEGLLDSIERRDLWWLRVDASGVAEAISLVGSWVVRSNLFVNPNKHVYELSSTRGPTRRGGGSGRTAWVIARSEPDVEGEAALNLIHSRFRGRELVQAHKAILWRLHFTTSVEPSDVPRMAGEIATARGRLRGLLTHPQFQSAKVVRASNPAQAAAAAFSGDSAVSDALRSKPAS
jgi:hypothetical protein